MTRSPAPAPATCAASRRPDAAAVRGRIERRHDLESRRATQALIDLGLVLNAPQRQAIAGQLADAPRPFAAFPPPHAALAAND